MNEFDVPGMSCGGCASRVTKAVQAVDPSAQVRVDLARQVVSVESTLEREVLTSALTSAGYPPH